MLFYIFIASICLIFARLKDLLEKNEKVFVDIILFIILFLVMGLRYDVGQDYFFTYAPLYEDYTIYHKEPDIEIGFSLIIKFLSLFSKDYAILFITIALIYTIFLFKTINSYKISNLFVIYILIFGGFYFYTMNVMRQCLATIIFYSGLPYIKERKLFRYLLTTVICSSLHYSFIITVPLYFILNIRLSFKFYFLLLIMAFISRFFILDLLKFFLNGTKYYNYLTGYYGDPSKQFNVSQIINIFMFFSYFLFLKKSKDKNAIIFMNMHFIGAFFTIFMGVIPLIFRITTIFYLIQFISLPYFCKYVLPKKYALIYISVFILVYLATFANTLMVNGNKILPYRTIFDR